MSKGPGTIQRLILDAARNGVTPRPERGPWFPKEPKVYPLLWIAHAAGYDVTKLSVRQSFSRAAYRLNDEDKIDLWNMPAPTGGRTPLGAMMYRDMRCISHPDQREHITKKDWEAAEMMCLLLIDDTTDPFRRLRRDFRLLSDEQSD